MDETGGIIIFIFMIVFIGLFTIVPLGLWIWSLIHCANNKKLDDNNRILGLILIVTLNLLGSFIYLFLPRNNKSDQ
ncbi:MAG: hypothetical protein COA79_08460 [Planctomycetota bacterium]|nr:MAG: hypothetical protein COA79_08460 [Planctomycetota bacterium]